MTAIHLDESAGERDSLVGAVDDVAPESYELAATVGGAVERRVEADRAGRTRAQRAPVGRLLRLRQRSLPPTPKSGNCRCYSNTTVFFCVSSRM